MGVGTGSSGGGTQKGHGEGVSPRSQPSRQGDHSSSGGGTRDEKRTFQKENFPQHTPSKLKGGIDASGTSNLSDRAPASRVSGEQNPRK
jgi:hypothetical protein